ncbi:MAG: hypothetical protein ACI841_003548 [Planctomycetota bacterium]|jgi:hypothetical protein
MPDGRPLELIHYQTPLKARQDDAGLGKVDLFGLLDARLPCLVELKVRGGDTPLRALDLEIHLVALRDATFEMGLNGTHPRLTGN